MEPIEKLERSSRRSAILSLIGILIFVSSLLYASFSLRKAEKNLEEMRGKLNATTNQLRTTTSQLHTIEKRISGLKHDEADMNGFILDLIESTRRNQGTGSSSMSEAQWKEIKNTILSLPSGRRKLAVNIALLTTWKDIPFQLAVNNIKSSFDSPGYIQYVLSQAGVNIAKRPNEPLSITLMKSFKKVDDPLPGDLMFYKGQIGNFGLIYLSPGIGIGTLQASARLSIYETKYMNTEYYPFLGYFRVNY